MLALDLSAIMAGSGIRGAFEEKFKALIRDIEEEGGNVICFIDELRKLIMSSSRYNIVNYLSQIPFSTSERPKGVLTLAR